MIDLFAGIGGFRLGFAEHANCVFTSEWDKFAAKTYAANFDGEIHGDITKIEASDIPDHDILVAGFPCQAFSTGGISTKTYLGRPSGFEDTRGTLFFDVARILAEKRPNTFLLENVKNLLSHDKGNTFRVIVSTLESLGYDLHYRVIDAKAFVPQHRERIFIVGRLKGLPFDFSKLVIPDASPKLESILDKDVDPKYILPQGTYDWLIKHRDKHQAKGAGYGCTVNGPNDVARTLSARYYKDGSEILIDAIPRPRKLSPRECARLMGYPESFNIVCSDTQSYKQFGNSVVVPVIQSIAKLIASYS